MALQPTKPVRWANSGGDIVEPTSGKKDVGWAAEERPPNSYMNWLQNLAYQWFNWLFEGKLARALLTDRTPVLAFCDHDQRERLYVDPAGYFGGPAIQEHYVVYPGNNAAGGSTGTIITPGLEVDADTNTSLSSLGASDVSQVPFVRLALADAASSQGVQVFSEGDSILIANVDDVVAIFETRLRFDLVGANEVDVFFGFHGDPNTALDPEDATAQHFAMLSKKSGETNWQMQVANQTAGTKTDTGTPPVVNVFQTFRIEYHGLATPVGVGAGFSVARFYIDGVLEGEIADTNGVITADGGFFNIGVRAKATATGPGAAGVDVDFTPIRLAFNQMLDWDVPA